MTIPIPSLTILSVDMKLIPDTSSKHFMIDLGLLITDLGLFAIPYFVIFALFFLSMGTIDILAHYISEHLPWLACHPALLALLVVCVPMILLILVHSWLN